MIEKRKEDEKGKERDQDFYADTGNRLLVQHYSKQISRFLGRPTLPCNRLRGFVVVRCKHFVFELKKTDFNSREVFRWKSELNPLIQPNDTPNRQMRPS